jgi:riboflavin synthase
MFNGIIESLGVVRNLIQEGTNLRLVIQSALASELGVKDSVAHNGVCLTVESVFPSEGFYSVVAVQETLIRSNLGFLQVGNHVNLERPLAFGGLVDGHFVQGHVDAMGYIRAIEDLGGSWKYYVYFPAEYAGLIVPKGSIAVNGISLTVVDVGPDWFSFAIIPYTYYHTNLRLLDRGYAVNLEFDILAKYIARLLAGYQAHLAN